jgi:hypothetical protein
VKYTVIWLKPAEADIWLAAEDRTSITRAARDIDRRLAVEPETAGEFRAEGKRILFVAPLGITFGVYEQDRIVRVADVWKFHTRS